MRRGLLLLPLLVVLAGALPPPLPAQDAPVLVLDRPDQRAPLGPYVEILEDTGRKLGILDVTSPEHAALFRPANQTWLNLGLGDSAWWLRFRLAQDPGLRLDPGEEWVVDLGWCRPGSARLFLPLPMGGGSEQFVGDPGEARPGDSPGQAASFLLPRAIQDKGACHLRITSSTSLFLPAEILSEPAYAEKIQVRSLGLGLYYGVMLAMLGLNLLFYLTLRDKSHAWYLLYVFFLTAYFLAYNGYLVRYVFGGRTGAELPVRLLLLGSFILCAAQFARSFLLTRRFAPEADRVLALVALATLAVMALTPAANPGVVIRYYALFGFISPAVALWSGVLVLRRGFRPARYYVAAWVVMGAGTTVHGLIHLNPLPLSPFTGFFFQGATGCEAVILAMALADRVRLLHREREELFRA